MSWDAFFTLHSDLPREGPGSAEDVEWAVRQAGVPEAARILDAGAGPGADVAALLDAVPHAHVTAIDTQADFVERIADTFRDAAVDARQSDMTEVTGPFDFIWCAGAIYFTGVTRTLSLWKKALAPGGHIAFSQPCYFTDDPSDDARALWGDDEDQVTTASGIERRITAAGFQTVASRKVSDAGWEAYYRPLEARMEQLRADADATLATVLDDTAREIALWRAQREETGYWLSVVRPV